MQTLTVGNETVQCYIAVGVSPPVAVACGDIYGKYIGLRSDTASICTGASSDTCLSRAAANVWTFNAGTSLRVPGYGAFGMSSAPNNANTGDVTMGRALISNDPNLGSIATRSGISSVYKLRFPTTAFDYVAQTGSISFLPNSTFSNNAQFVHAGKSETITAYGNAITGVSYYSQYDGVTIAGPLSMTLVHNYRPLTTFAANWTGTIGDFFGLRDSYTVTAGASGSITRYEAVSPAGCPTSGVTCASAHALRCRGSMGGTGSNSCVRIAEQTGGTNNAAIHLDSNSATCGAGLVAGTAFDTCLYRSRAGAWTGPAGTDIYTDSGYICGGPTCSAVTSTAQGVYDSGVRVMSSVSCTGATCALTNGALSITVSGGGGGVTSLAGTSGEVEVSAATGAVTVGLPSAWTPSFTSVLLTSSTGGTGIRMDALGSFLVYETASGDDVFGYDLATAQLSANKHVHFVTPNPTYTFGAAAGTSPTGSGTATGSDEVFTVQFTTGTSPAANDVVFALSWAFTWSSAPQVLFSAQNSASAVAMTSVFVDSVSTGSMTFSVGAVALQAATTYKWTFHAFGAL